MKNVFSTGELDEKVVSAEIAHTTEHSVSENEEGSTVNQDKMKEMLKDYNDMYGTRYKIEGINAYNSNLRHGGTIRPVRE